MPDLQSAAQLFRQLLPGIPILPKPPLAIVAEQAVKTSQTLEQVMHDLQKSYLIELLEACQGNQCVAARRAGVHRNTLGRYIDTLDINVRAIWQRFHGGRKPVEAVSL